MTTDRRLGAINNVDSGFLVIVAHSRNGAAGKRAAGAGHKPAGAEQLSPLSHRGFPLTERLIPQRLTPSLTVPYPELRCSRGIPPAAAPPAPIGVTQRLSASTHFIPPLLGEEGADGLICFPLLTAANPLGRHPSPWRPQHPSDAPPLKVSASPAPQTAPPPSSPGSPPLGDPREPTGAPPWRNGASPLARPAKGWPVHGL